MTCEGNPEETLSCSAGASFEDIKSRILTAYHSNHPAETRLL